MKSQAERARKEGSTVKDILEGITLSEDWPIKSGHFVVSAILDHSFANFAEDAVSRRTGAFTEINCTPAEAEGSTRVSFRADYSSFTREAAPRPDDYTELDELAS